MLRLQTPLPERYTAATAGRARTRGSARPRRRSATGCSSSATTTSATRSCAGPTPGATRTGCRVLAQERPEAEYIVFCGVHFMAESADILTADHQQVILPDLNAGCSMADMADIDEVEEAWEALAGVIDIDRLVPITYMNSSAALKAFVGRHGGAVCTSTNARAVLEWALGAGRRRRATRCCSSPTSTSAATPAWPWATATTTCGCGTPASSSAGSTEADCKDATFLLWKGHCSVHQRFRPEHVAAFRAEHPDGIVVVHPECRHERCALADQVGSTDFIIRAVEPRRRPARSSPSAPRSTWCNGSTHETPTRPSCRSTR